MPIIGAKDVNEMTRREFEELPQRERWDEEIECSSLVVLPSRRLHGSGFRCMAFVLVQENIAFMRVGGGSDVVHIDGIGGFGYRWSDREGAMRFLLPPSGWGIDCLKKSGLLRLFPASHRVMVGASLSSFEIWALPDERRGRNAEAGNEGSPR
jgi:hypothetical protein